MSTDEHDEDQGNTVLAIFKRKNRQTGAFEQVRISTGDFNGRQVTHFRTYFQAHRNPTPSDDGYRPTKLGVVVREDEVDRAIEALIKVKAEIERQGRCCSPAPEGQRNPRPRTVAKQRARENAQQQQQPARPSTPAPQRPGFELEAEDSLAEFRRRR
jgi:hypothetical protein